MNRKEVIDVLKEIGICDKYPRVLDENDSNEDVLLTMATLDGMDFIGEREFPKPSFLISEFGSELERFGYYVKKLGELRIDKHSVKNHIVASTLDVYIPDYYVGILYVSNKSSVRLHVGDFCDLRVSNFEGSGCELISSGKDSFVKYKFKHVGNGI